MPTAIVLIILVLLGFVSWLVVTQPPGKVASLLVKSGPVVLIGMGIVLTLIGRGFIGLPLIFFGTAWLRRNRPMGSASPRGTRKSTVRSDYLEMELDHDTGEMDGTVLSGSRRGSRLSSLDEQSVMALSREFQADADTLRLLESYLDRQYPGWRERHDGEPFSDHGGPSGNQPMSKQEACQILGVEPNATREEILQAWRRLIKKVHPDSGGSAFLSAKINAAKEVLLG